MFLDIFQGEHVEIITKLIISDPNGNPTSFAIFGYLLDSDGVYCYMGDSPLQVTKAIKKEEISIIEIVEPDGIYKKILEEMPTPEDEEDEN